MSTPLIPITDEVVVMPLIGTIDRARATQTLAVALEGAQKHRARVVILDVTGIKLIDSDVAGTLIGIAGALRLLGAEAVLTGVAPGIARTLVDLGIDSSTVNTTTESPRATSHQPRPVFARESLRMFPERCRPGSQDLSSIPHHRSTLTHMN